MELKTSVTTYIYGNEITRNGRGVKSIADRTIRVVSDMETSNPTDRQKELQQWRLSNYIVNNAAVPNAFYIESVNSATYTWFVDNGNILTIAQDIDVFLIEEVEPGAGAFTIELYNMKTKKGTGLYLTMEDITAGSKLELKALVAGKPPKQKWIFAQMIGG